MQTSVCWRTAACLEHCWGRGDNRIGVAMNGAIYHERQVKELCALHALNNLFQERDAFSKTELDAICYSLSPNVWINPHKSLLGLGNYDINVIMAALQRKGHEAIWFDKRKDPKCLNLDNILGFILNVPSDYKLGFVLLPLRRRHWVTIRQIHGTYYNLDSKLESPQLIGRASQQSRMASKVPRFGSPRFFFLRGYLKDRVFKRHSENLEQLRQFILQEMTTFTPEILQAVYDNMVKRVRKCLDVNGGHVEPFV
ncbi:josephin-2-like isoform X2 [Periplaneta americana]|uniref:josephin-2-like isoform X2 n=1 Tax=Periplaneta americana TaxID=6978 RepID=UPI0037E7B37C